MRANTPAMARGRAGISLVGGLALITGFLIATSPSAAPILAAASVATIAVTIGPRLLGLPSRPILYMQVGLAMHIAIGTVVASSSRLTSYLGPDANYYHTVGAALSQHLLGLGAAPDLPTGKEGFAYMVAALYALGGPTRYAVVIVNACLMAMTIGVTWWTASRLYGPRVADRVLPLFLVLPGLVIWPPQLLREAGIFLLLAIVAALATELARKIRLATLIAFAAAGALLFTFRGPVGLVMLGGVAVAVASGSSRSLRGFVASTVATGAILGIIFAFGVGLAGLRLAADVDLEQLNASRRELSTQAYSGFGADVDISTPGRALAYLPVALVNFILGPAPWQVRSLRQLPAIVDAAAWWFLLPSLLRGIRHDWRANGRRVLIILIPAVLLTASMALTTANFGIIVRLRTQVTIVLLPLIALGLDRRRIRSSEASKERPIVPA